MKRWITQINRAAQRRLPFAYYHLIQRSKIRFQFQTEKQLLGGAQLSKSVHPSILFFTTQKCASRYVARVIGRLTQAEGMPSVDYDAYVTMSQVPKELNPYSHEGALDYAFRPTGYSYGPIGSFREIPQAEKYRVVLQLRDPRDVLTSLYFSTAYSHALINPKMLKRRKEALQSSIDEYVLRNASLYVDIYSTYCERMLSAPHVLFLKYETMVEDFHTWLSRLSEHLGFSSHQEILKQLEEQANFEVNHEDKFDHRRQVTPGDHRRKLRANTIDELNRLFASILEALDYPL